MKAFLAAHPRPPEQFNSSMPSHSRPASPVGASTPVRWSMVTAEPFEPEAPDQATVQGKNYLFDALIARVEQAPLQWHLIVTIGQPDDPTNDATTPWPDNREHVDVGTLTINHIESETPGNCRDV